MYQYYEKTFGQPVYVCVGQGTEEFRKDVEAIGLLTETITGFEQPIVLAVDPLNNDLHFSALNLVKLEIFKHGGLGPDVEDHPKDGPFPEEREFPIYTTWMMWGLDHVSAKTLQQAMDDAIENRALPDGNYVNDSQTIDFASTVGEA